MLIGRNGVGKTQLLQAIKKGSVSVSDILTSEIEIYNLASFTPQDLRRASWGSSSFAERTAEKYLSKKSISAPVKVAENIFQQVIKDFELTDGSDDRRQFEKELRNEIDGMRVLSDFPQVKSSNALLSYSRQIQSTVINPLKVKNQQNRNTRNDSGFLVNLAMKLTRKLPHEISRDDVLRAANFEGTIIENTLSDVFTRYKVEQYSWAHTVGRGKSNEHSKSNVAIQGRKDTTVGSLERKPRPNARGRRRPRTVQF